MDIRIKYSWRFFFAYGLSGFFGFQFSFLLSWNDANKTMFVVQERKNTDTYKVKANIVCGAVFKKKRNVNKIIEIIIHSKNFPVSDWLKPHA